MDGEQHAVETETPTGQETVETERGQETAQNYALTHDDVIQLAKENGWKPDGPQDAKTFIKTMTDRFRNNSHELRNMKKSVDAIKNTFDKAQELAYQRGVQEAQERLKVAKDSFDVEAVERATIELEQAKSQKVVTAPVLSPEAETFANNPIFDKDPVMFADAMDYRDKYLKVNPGDIDGALLYAQKKIAKDYPDVFGAEKPTIREERKPPAASVESVSNNAASNVAQWQKDAKLLLPHEKEMMKSFTSQLHNGKPVMTEQQYIENLRAKGIFEGRK